MPTIEIASFSAPRLGLRQSDFEVAIKEENKLESHRGLFYHLLRQQQGAMVHIGNPDQKNGESGFFGGQLIDWSLGPEEIFIPEYDRYEPEANHGANQQFAFRFLEEYRHEIDTLLLTALVQSPIKKVCFLTDYQFGPAQGRVEIIYTLNDFWELHDGSGLIFNTLYELYG